MTSLKYFVAIGAMLLVGWGPAPAATTDDTTTEAGAASSETPKSHHKKHHTKTAASNASSISSAKTPGDASQPSGKNSSAAATAKATTSKTSTTPGGTAPSATTDATKPPATTASTTGKNHKKKGHGKTTESASALSTNTPGDLTATAATAPATTAKTTAPAPATKNATPPATTPGAASANSCNSPAIGAAAVAAAGVTGQAAVAPTGKGKHRRHGATTPSTQPAAVVNPATVAPVSPPPAVPPPPATTVSEAKPPTSTVPKIETSPPVPRVGAGTTASLAIVRSPAPDGLPHFNFNDYPTRKHATQSYPWKAHIVTTVFWIGEGATPMSSMTNLQSAWDGNWVHNNGGADDQYALSGYASSEHASTLNPFYVALPFNDLAYPDKTNRWLPQNWSRPSRRGEKMVSACQHRWIEIKNLAGRVCFAQWEDVGPVVTDDAEYVFGTSRPSASRGLDVSPAVAKFLGLGSTAYTSWRFVDDEDVQPGMWLRYDEQALLFRAMKERLHGGHPGNPRIQALEEPTPDESDDAANQKKIGAARG